MSIYIRLISLCILLPFSLYGGWGDADKLSDGSCKFEKESGYADARLYTKGEEAFVIVDTVDTRYGTTSVVYNALTCEKITSGSKYESNFASLMRKKGFKLASLRSGQNIDKSFENKISYSNDSDAATVKVAKLDSSITQELGQILSPVSNRKRKPTVHLSGKSKTLIKTREFKNAFLQKINNTSKSHFNYRYALNLNKKIGNYSDVKYSIFKKYLHHKVKKVSQLASWAKGMHALGGSNFIGKLQSETMKVSGFGKNLTLNNFLSSNEYKYALKYSTPKISKILDDAIYGLKLDYGNKTIKLTARGSCKSTGDTSSTGGCGFMWVNECRWTYANYRCRANTSKVAKIERKLKSSTSIARSLGKGWKYNYTKSKVTIWTPPASTYTAPSEGGDTDVKVTTSSNSGNTRSSGSSNGIKKIYVHAKRNNGQSMRAIICNNGKSRHGNWKRNDGLWMTFGTMAGHQGQSLSEYANDFCR